MPASPKAGKFLVGKNENVARSPKLPAPRPSTRRAERLGGVLDQGQAVAAGHVAQAPAGRPAAPNTCTATIARVRSVTAASAAAGSRLNVPGSMSANTGVAPTRAIASAVA